MQFVFIFKYLVGDILSFATIALWFYAYVCFDNILAFYV